MNGVRKHYLTTLRKAVPEGAGGSWGGAPMTLQLHRSPITCDPGWLPRVLVDTVAVLLLSSVLIALSYDGVGRGTFGGYDEPRHMMDGVFFADFYYDLPLSHIYQYAVEYFVRFPALSLSWSPPMFSAIAGIVLLVGGLNHILVRLLLESADFSVIFWQPVPSAHSRESTARIAGRVR